MGTSRPHPLGAWFAHFNRANPRQTSGGTDELNSILSQPSNSFIPSLPTKVQSYPSSAAGFLFTPIPTQDTHPRQPNGPK